MIEISSSLSMSYPKASNFIATSVADKISFKVTDDFIIPQIKKDVLLIIGNYQTLIVPIDDIELDNSKRLRVVSFTN